MSAVYVCMHKFARLGWSKGMLTQEIFEIRCSEKLLRPFWDRSTLKKQVGCFNHRVVALVAIMSGLCEVSLVLET